MPGDLLELRGERRPALGGAQPEFEQSPARLAKLHLCDGSEHARRNTGGPAADRIALEQRDTHAPLARSPRHSEANDAAPDDDDVRRALADYRGHSV